MKYLHSRLFYIIIVISLVILPLINVIVSIVHTPFFTTYTSLEEDTLFMLSSVENRFIIFGSSSHTSYSKAYFSYAPIYLNLTTAGGWSNQIKEPSYIDMLKNLLYNVENKVCGQLIDNLNALNVTDIITYDLYCKILDDCGLKQINDKNQVCLYRL